MKKQDFRWFLYLFGVVDKMKHFYDRQMLTYLLFKPKTVERDKIYKNRPEQFTKIIFNVSIYKFFEKILNNTIMTECNGVFHIKYLMVSAIWSKNVIRSQDMPYMTCLISSVILVLGFHFIDPILGVQLLKIYFMHIYHVKL